MKNSKYETMAHHMKGFMQGLLFIIIIIMIIIFFQFIGYIDRSFSGTTYSDNEDDGIEYWSDEIEHSDGIRGGNEKTSDTKIYEQRRKDFGSKSLNEKDRDKAEKDKEQEKKKSNDYLKK